MPKYSAAYTHQHGDCQTDTHTSASGQGETLAAEFVSACGNTLCFKQNIMLIFVSKKTNIFNIAGNLRKMLTDWLTVYRWCWCSRRTLCRSTWWTGATPIRPRWGPPSNWSCRSWAGATPTGSPGRARWGSEHAQQQWLQFVSSWIFFKSHTGINFCMFGRRHNLRKVRILVFFMFLSVSSFSLFWAREIPLCARPWHRRHIFAWLYVA